MMTIILGLLVEEVVVVLFDEDEVAGEGFCAHTIVVQTTMMLTPAMAKYLCKGLSVKRKGAFILTSFYY